MCAGPGDWGIFCIKFQNKTPLSSPWLGSSLGLGYHGCFDPDPSSVRPVKYTEDGEKAKRLDPGFQKSM